MSSYDCSGEGDYVSSVQWATDSMHLAVGTSDAKVQIWDAARAKQVRGQGRTHARARARPTVLDDENDEGKSLYPRF